MGQSMDTYLKWLNNSLLSDDEIDMEEYSPLIRHHRLRARPPGSEHQKQCWGRGSVLEFSCSFVMDVWLYTYIHIYPYIHIHIHIHTWYMDTVMVTYTHILGWTLTFSCQTTFISASFEIMNGVCPFLQYVTWRHHH
jgi:hypothetical protein